MRLAAFECALDREYARVFWVGQSSSRFIVALGLRECEDELLGKESDLNVEYCAKPQSDSRSASLTGDEW